MTWCSPNTHTTAVDVETVKEEEQTALNCKHIVVDTRDFMFKAVYDFYNEINDYYIFATSDHTAYLVVDTTGVQKTWLYNYAEKTSCYFNSPDGAVIELGPGVWTKPRTRDYQTTNILITLGCQSALLSEHDDAIVLWGLTEAAFITMVVVLALILITVLIIGVFCWWKRTERFHKEYDYYSKATKKKKARNRKGNDVPQEYDATDDDDDDFESDAVGHHDQDLEQHNAGHSVKSSIPKINIKIKKKDSAHHYTRAPSHSSMRNHGSNASLTIIRHIRTPNEAHSGYHSSKASLSDDSIGLEMQSGFHRIRSDSNPIDADEDDDDMVITNDIVDHEDSTSTVFPFDVQFSADDKNTVMLDHIALDIKRQKERERLQSMNEDVRHNTGSSRIYRFGSVHKEKS